MSARQRLRPLLWAVGGAAVGVLFVMAAVVTITVYVVVGDIRETQKSSRSILEFIENCTEPEGECYQESEARDAEQAGAFNAAVIAAAWCASKDPATIRELTVCVGKILDGKGHNR